MYKLSDVYHITFGFLITMSTLLFGKNWFVFVLFLSFNIIDWLTGWMKARLSKRESSMIGLRGVIKKLGLWILLFFSFLISAGFIELGNILHIDLTITELLGYFVLASLIVNEARSIVENFVEMGYRVPSVLTKGLEVADKMINKEGEADEKRTD